MQSDSKLEACVWCCVLGMSRREKRGASQLAWGLSELLLDGAHLERKLGEQAGEESGVTVTSECDLFEMLT